MNKARLQLNRCLEPSWQCSDRAIRAHSVQNSRVLELLERDNHVIGPKLTATMEGGPEIEFGLIGRNKATTFTGLCARHDNLIFAPIEKKPLCLSDPEQLFLLAYRAATRELHATLEAATKLQMAYKELVERGLASATEMSPAGLEATERILIASETFKYRCGLDEALQREDFSTLEHDVIIVRTDRPTVAASSLFSLDNFVINGDVVLVHLNVLPASVTETAVTFSYTRPNAGPARLRLDRVVNSSGHHQLYELSRLLLDRCENFVLSPDYFDRWPSEKAKAIRDYFLASLQESQTQHESEHLYLF